MKRLAPLPTALRKASALALALIAVSGVGAAASEEEDAAHGPSKGTLSVSGPGGSQAILELKAPLHVRVPMEGVATSAPAAGVLVLNAAGEPRPKIGYVAVNTLARPGHPHVVPLSDRSSIVLDAGTYRVVVLGARSAAAHLELPSQTRSLALKASGATVSRVDVRQAWEGYAGSVDDLPASWVSTVEAFADGTTAAYTRRCLRSAATAACSTIGALHTDTGDGTVTARSTTYPPGTLRGEHYFEATSFVSPASRGRVSFALVTVTVPHEATAGSRPSSTPQEPLTKSVRRPVP
jgi:hypothetical protein